MQFAHLAWMAFSKQIQATLAHLWVWLTSRWSSLAWSLEPGQQTQVGWPRPFLFCLTAMVQCWFTLCFILPGYELSIEDLKKGFRQHRILRLRSPRVRLRSWYRNNDRPSRSRHHQRCWYGDGWKNHWLHDSIKKATTSSITSLMCSWVMDLSDGRYLSRSMFSSRYARSW